MKIQISSFLLLFALFSGLIQQGACYDVNFTTEDEVTNFWLSARKLVNYFHYGREKYGLNPEAILKEKEISERLQTLIGTMGEESGSSSTSSHLEGGLTEAFSTLKHEASRMPEHAQNLFLLENFFHFIAAFLDAVEHQIKHSPNESPEKRENCLKIAKAAKKKNEGNLAKLLEYKNSKKGLKTADHMGADNANAKFNVKFHGTVSALPGMGGMEITNLKNSLDEDIIADLIRDGHQIKVEAGREKKITRSFGYAVWEAQFTLSKTQETFLFTREGENQFLVTDEKKGKKRRVRVVDNDVFERTRDYDLEFKINDDDEIQLDIYIHQYLIPDLFDLSFTGESRHGIGNVGAPHQAQHQTSTSGGMCKLPQGAVQNSKMWIGNVYNGLRVPIYVQKDGETARTTIRPGATEYIDQHPTITLIIGELDKGAEVYILTDIQDWRLKVRNCYINALATMDVVWRDRDGFMGSAYGNYDIKITYDEATKRVWFNLHRYKDYLEFAFDGYKSWNQQSYGIMGAHETEDQKMQHHHGASSGSKMRGGDGK